MESVFGGLLAIGGGYGFLLASGKNISPFRACIGKSAFHLDIVSAC